jgi:hypothetical protein
LIRVDTMRDTGSAGVGAMTTDAGVGGGSAAAVEETGAAVRAAGVAAADCVVDANDDAPASTTRLKSRLLSRTVGSAAAALTTAGLALVVTGVEPDPGRASPRWRGSVPDVSGVARVPARPVEEVEVDGVRTAVVNANPDESAVVLVCGPPELLIAVLRDRLGASFVADDALLADGVSDDVEPEFPDELDDDSSDDEPLPESPGAANATAGVLATPNPTPSATARAHMQPMCFAFSMGGFPFAHPRRINGRLTLSTPYRVHG